MMMKILKKTGHLFYTVGNGFIKVLRLIPGFNNLSLRDQQIGASLFLMLIAALITAFIIFYISTGNKFAGMENPVELNLVDYQQNQILQALNELYNFEGNTDQAVVGKIRDIDLLKSRYPYPFLQKARNGEYLIIMPDLVVVYDFENRQIMDISKTNMLNLRIGEE